MLAKMVHAADGATAAPWLTEAAELHALAEEYHVLTPASSLIALVNDRQRDALAEASHGEAAFAPPGAGTEEELDAPSGRGLLNVQGVPEPETWILLTVGAVLLALFASRQQAG